MCKKPKRYYDRKIFSRNSITIFFTYIFHSILINYCCSGHSSVKYFVGQLTTLDVCLVFDINSIVSVKQKIKVGFPFNINVKRDSTAAFSSSSSSSSRIL